jgi:hypothetical protein
MLQRSHVVFVCSAKTPAEAPAAHYEQFHVDRASQPSGLLL